MMKTNDIRKFNKRGTTDIQITESESTYPIHCDIKTCFHPAKTEIAIYNTRNLSLWLCPNHLQELINVLTEKG